MILASDQIQEHNGPLLESHRIQWTGLVNQLALTDGQTDTIVELIEKFSVAIPSWALGAGGTRFGRFTYGGEPRSLEEKIEDVGVIHALTKSAGSISLHIPWDIPDDPGSVKELAASLDIVFDAVNSNTFQDQPGQKHSYKFGSLSNEHQNIRAQAIEHNLKVIEYGKKLGSKALTVWLADGSSFPGQASFRQGLDHTLNSLAEIYNALPDDWRLLIEYKPYEPYFYHMVIPDWGTSYMMAAELGDKAFTLVDLGHHLPNTNIENIVSTLMYRGKLGGFHFNDSKFGDDDLTVGCIKPYQLFLIFNELVAGRQIDKLSPEPDWMIDASHNLKDPLEDLIQSLDAILIAFAKSLMLDRKELREAQASQDIVRCQELLQHAYLTDVRPLLREARLRAGGAIDPIKSYRELDIRRQLIKTRGESSKATGL